MGLPRQAREIIYAGDFNSWATNRAGDAPRKYLLGQGFDDSYAAESRINAKYPTINHYKTTLSAKGVRLDYLMVKGCKKMLRYENVMKRVDSSRPSDHNLIVSDIVL